MKQNAIKAAYAAHKISFFFSYDQFVENSIFFRVGSKFVGIFLVP